ncbi:MAG: cation:proton antiporter regulatory subunit [Planctomycetota bacterium]|jgi:Trk-type K+ transport system membrane component
MNLVLFITVLIISFVIVRIGAIAFHLTGLDWSLAKFQALSCFTSTGFTTKEAELVTANRQRRRIASILIVLGHAGLVTMVATFANTLRPRATAWSIPFLPGSIDPSMLPWINLGIVVVATYAIYRVVTNTRLVRKFTNALRQRLIKKEIIEPVSFEELAIATGGYGVSKVQISKDSWVLNKSLAESQLRGRNVNVLAVIRGVQTIPNPPPDTRIMLGDELLCFGKLGDMRNELYAKID